ncbi:MAG: hypothetical protein ABS911_14245 [Carnobacterium sp.]
MTNFKDNKDFIKKELSSLSKTFVISFIVAWFITNSENFIFSFLNNIGLTNELFQKTVLSAVVTAGIGFTKLLIFVITKFILNNLEPLEISLILTNKGESIDSPIEFHPKNSEYEEQGFEITVSFKAKGELNIIMMKYIGIVINVYFNPKILDIYFSNGWKVNILHFK